LPWVKCPVLLLGYEENNGKTIAVFIYDGHRYHFDKRSKDIYRCALRRTSNCCGVLLRNQDETYTLKTSHNHSANKTVLQETKMKEEMLRIYRETSNKPKDIFDLDADSNSIC